MLATKRQLRKYEPAAQWGQGEGNYRYFMLIFASIFTSKVCPQTSWVSESANRVCEKVELPTVEDSDIALELIERTAAPCTRQGASKGPEGLG